MKVLIIAIISSLCVSSFAMSTSTSTNSGGSIMQELMTYISNNPALYQSLVQQMQMAKQQQQQQQQQNNAPTTPPPQQPSQGSNLPAGPNQPSVPNMPNMNAMNSNALGMSLAQRLALAALMKPKFYLGQPLRRKGLFPGGVVISADGSDATVQTRAGRISIDGNKYCISEFMCVRIL